MVCKLLLSKDLIAVSNRSVPPSLLVQWTGMELGMTSGVLSQPLDRTGCTE